MSIESKVSPSGQAPSARKQWTTPDVQIVDLNTARTGTVHNAIDSSNRS